jgi:tetratricopeptide (TPR) repeat protein
MNPFKLWWSLLLVGGLVGANVCALLAYHRLPPAAQVAQRDRGSDPGPAAPERTERPKSSEPAKAPQTRVPKKKEEPRKPEKKEPEKREPEKKEPEKKEPRAKTPEPETKKPEKEPEEKDPSKEKEREKFEAEMRQARALVKEKKVRAALKHIAAALVVRPVDAEAIDLEKQAVALQEKGDAAVARARAALARKDYEQAVDLLKQAAALVADNPDVPGLLKSAQKEQLEQVLPGSVLVLVLHTRNSRKVTSSLGEREMTRQLHEVVKTYGTEKLLGKKVWVLTRSGPQPWAPGPAPAFASAFENKECVELFAAAFKAVAELTVRASQKKFRTILVWETDWDADRKVVPPKGRDVRLCYRFTDRDNDAAKLGEWFGDSEDRPTVSRFTNVVQLKGFVKDFIDP